MDFSTKVKGSIDKIIKAVDAANRRDIEAQSEEECTQKLVQPGLPIGLIVECQEQDPR